MASQGPSASQERLLRSGSKRAASDAARLDKQALQVAHGQVPCRRRVAGCNSCPHAVKYFSRSLALAQQGLLPDLQQVHGETALYSLDCTSVPIKATLAQLMLCRPGTRYLLPRDQVSELYKLAASHRIPVPTDTAEHAADIQTIGLGCATAGTAPECS